jgi:hypothetical protein
MPSQSASPPGASPSDAQLQQLFLAAMMPRLASHADVCLAGVRCSQERADLRAEMFALGWEWFVRLAQHGKKPDTFPTAIATFAGRAVKSGRRLSGQLSAKDVLSPVAQRRHGFTVGPLPEFTTANGDVIDEALHDNTQTPPAEQAAFRVDFPAWVGRRSDRDRRLIREMMVGERTRDIAAGVGLTPGRVSQLRREFRDDWSAFCGDAVCQTGQAVTTA